MGRLSTTKCTYLPTCSIEQTHKNPEDVDMV